MVDKLDLISVWGDIGHLKGYINGLRIRTSDLKLRVTKVDFDNLEMLLERLEAHLEEACSYKEVK